MVGLEDDPDAALPEDAPYPVLSREALAGLRQVLVGRRGLHKRSLLPWDEAFQGV
jgi:hypothetical protein